MGVRASLGSSMIGVVDGTCVSECLMAEDKAAFSVRPICAAFKYETVSLPGFDKCSCDIC